MEPGIGVSRSRVASVAEELHALDQVILLADVLVPLRDFGSHEQEGSSDSDEELAFLPHAIDYDEGENAFDDEPTRWWMPPLAQRRANRRHHFRFPSLDRSSDSSGREGRFPSLDRSSDSSGREGTEPPGGMEADYSLDYSWDGQTEYPDEPYSSDDPEPPAVRLDPRDTPRYRALACLSESAHIVQQIAELTRMVRLGGITMHHARLAVPARNMSRKGLMNRFRRSPTKRDLCISAWAMADLSTVRKQLRRVRNGQVANLPYEYICGTNRQMQPRPSVLVCYEEPTKAAAEDDAAAPAGLNAGLIRGTWAAPRHRFNAPRRQRPTLDAPSRQRPPQGGPRRQRPPLDAPPGSNALGSLSGVALRDAVCLFVLLFVQRQQEALARRTDPDIIRSVNRVGCAKRGPTGYESKLFRSRERHANQRQNCGRRPLMAQGVRRVLAMHGVTAAASGRGKGGASDVTSTRGQAAASLSASASRPNASARPPLCTSTAPVSLGDVGADVCETRVQRLREAARLQGSAIAAGAYPESSKISLGSIRVGAGTCAGSGELSHTSGGCRIDRKSKLSEDTAARVQPIAGAPYEDGPASTPRTGIAASAVGYLHAVAYQRAQQQIQQILVAAQPNAANGQRDRNVAYKPGPIEGLDWWVPLQVYRMRLQGLAFLATALLVLAVFGVALPMSCTQLVTAHALASQGVDGFSNTTWTISRTDVLQGAAKSCGMGAWMVMPSKPGDEQSEDYAMDRLSRWRSSPYFLLYLLPLSLWLLPKCTMPCDIPEERVSESPWLTRTRCGLVWWTCWREHQTFEDRQRQVLSPWENVCIRCMGCMSTNDIYPGKLGEYYNASVEHGRKEYSKRQGVLLLVVPTRFSIWSGQMWATWQLLVPLLLSGIGCVLADHVVATITSGKGQRAGDDQNDSLSRSESLVPRSSAVWITVAAVLVLVSVYSLQCMTRHVYGGFAPDRLFQLAVHEWSKLALHRRRQILHQYLDLDSVQVIAGHWLLVNLGISLVLLFVAAIFALGMIQDVRSIYGTFRDIATVLGCTAAAALVCLGLIQVAVRTADGDNGIKMWSSWACNIYERRAQGRQIKVSAVVVVPFLIGSLTPLCPLVFVALAGQFDDGPQTLYSVLFGLLIACMLAFAVLNFWNSEVAIYRAVEQSASLPRGYEENAIQYAEACQVVAQERVRNRFQQGIPRSAGVQLGEDPNARAMREAVSRDLRQHGSAAAWAGPPIGKADVVAALARALSDLKIAALHLVDANLRQQFGAKAASVRVSADAHDMPKAWMQSRIEYLRWAGELSRVLSDRQQQNSCGAGGRAHDSSTNSGGGCVEMIAGNLSDSLRDLADHVVLPLPGSAKPKQEPSLAVSWQRMAFVEGGWQDICRGISSSFAFWSLPRSISDGGATQTSGSAADWQPSGSSIGAACRIPVQEVNDSRAVSHLATQGDDAGDVPMHEALDRANQALCARVFY